MLIMHFKPHETLDGASAETLAAQILKKMQIVYTTGDVVPLDSKFYIVNTGKLSDEVRY